MRAIDFFDRGLLMSPEGDCLKDEAGSHTYSQVALLTHRIANAIRGVGLRRGSKAAILSPNHVLALASLLGILRSGAIWLPVHARNALADSAEFLKEHGCELLFFHSQYAQEAQALHAAVPSLRHSVCIDIPFGTHPGMTEWCRGAGDCFPEDEHGPEDVAWIKTTGGTTGRSKSVMVCHRNIETMLASFHVCMSLDRPHVNLMAAPMTHGAGNIAMATFATGGTVVSIARPDPVAILDAIERHAVTTLFLPPTVIYALLDTPGVRDRDCSSLRYFVYGAAPMSAEKLAEAIEVFGPVMAQAWGQAEAPLICTYLAPQEHFKNGRIDPNRLKSCGRSTLLARVEVMDDDGNLLPVGQTGELVVRSNLVTHGYFNRPEENEVISRFGWHHTGDVGYRDREGFFYIVDRKKDMIISGGFNIYPSEVEQALWRHPAVLDCAVIGVPDPKWGEAVKAIVELKNGQAATTDELQAHCRAIVGGMKTPKSVEIWAELPRSNVGKVLKREIRERYWQGQERRV